MIKCCKGCVSPKRHPGCHATCKEYIKEKAEYEEKKKHAEKSVQIKQSDFEMFACMHRGRKYKKQ